MSENGRFQEAGPGGQSGAAQAPQATLEQRVGALENALAHISRLTYTLSEGAGLRNTLIAQVAGQHGAMARQLAELGRHAEALDRRVGQLEQLCSLAPGQVNLTDAYQLIVDDLAAVKRAVIELQQRARGDAGQTAPDLSIPARH